MANGKLSFDQEIKQQAARLLPRLNDFRRLGVQNIDRNTLLNESGLNDNELQKLIHDGNMPRHSGKRGGIKVYDVLASLQMLARYCGQYGYLVD
ncbi:MAG: hypothetical protein ACTILK_00575 [Bifidobacterium crudilactis]|uniref:hypothetical protein n=1 Tax=Bifidobacterium crudilactis TaxID=327277 RepID=UPI003F9579E0